MQILPEVLCVLRCRFGGDIHFRADAVKGFAQPTATANKFAGMLSGLYPEAGKVKSIFGYQIATMYDFFMVFVVMSGVASLILFLLSKKLQKMMHGVE